MPTQTGTASTAVDLLNQLNTFLTSNGWTKIRGETDMTCNSPKAARYWRILVFETDDTNYNYREIEKLEWRETSGGPNLATDNAKYSFSSINGSFDLVGGTIPAISYDIGGDMWWVCYDFTTPTIIRELLMKCDTQGDAPARFAIQWSNDKFSWTTMKYYVYDSNRFTGNDQTITLTIDSGSGYLDPIHAANDKPRRSGHSLYQSGGSKTRYNEWCDDIWCWQGPGYDADRRVYTYAIPSYDLDTLDEFISWGGSIAVDTTLPSSTWFKNQEGCYDGDFDVNRPTHYMSSNGVAYWFYCNSKRFIVVTKNGVDDYTMSYVGFLSAFAQPEDFPFPLYLGGCGNSLEYSLNTSGTYVRDGQDPTYRSAYYRSFDNTWRMVQNHDLDSSRSENWRSDPTAFVYPKHIGPAGIRNFPYSVMGSAVYNEGHFMKNIDPTEQGDLPVFPAVVGDTSYGFIGALDGVFAVPKGGVLAPEATFTIGTDTYRVFSTRNWSDGNQYYCIKEN